MEGRMKNMRRMIGNGCMLLLCGMVLTGCQGNADTVTNGENVNITSETVSEAEIDHQREALQEKYPEWFDEEGQVSYPHQPGDEEWKAAKSHEKLVELVQVPREIIDDLTTEELLEVVEENPLFGFDIYDSVSLGVEQMAGFFSAMDCLLEREDVGTVAWKHFVESQVSDEELKESEDGYPNRLVSSLVLEEYIMSQQKIFDQITKEEGEELTSLAENLERQKEMVSLNGPSYDWKLEK